MTTIYGWLIAAALVICGGWYAHHHVYAQGYDAARKADDKAINDAADANAAMQNTLAAAEGAAAECVAGREADAKAATDAAAAAEKARSELAARFKTADKALHDKMAGECRDWARQPACGSVP